MTEQPTSVESPQTDSSDTLWTAVNNWVVTKLAFMKQETLLLDMMRGKKVGDILRTKTKTVRRAVVRYPGLQRIGERLVYADADANANADAGVEADADADADADTYAAINACVQLGEKLSQYEHDLLVLMRSSRLGTIKTDRGRVRRMNHVIQSHEGNTFVEWLNFVIESPDGAVDETLEIS